jgi:hypothetical protein
MAVYHLSKKMQRIKLYKKSIELPCLSLMGEKKIEVFIFFSENIKAMKEIVIFFRMLLFYYTCPNFEGVLI